MAARIAFAALAASLFAFVLAPIVVVVVASFSAGAVPEFPPSSWSLRWYEHALAQPVFLSAARNSAVLAALSTAINVPIALAAALALSRGRFPGREAVQTILLAPLVVPAVVTGISILLAFSAAGWRDAMSRLLLAHVVITLPYMVRTVMATLARLDPLAEEAAMTLGADRLRVFLHVTLPLLLPGLAAGAVLRQRVGEPVPRQRARQHAAGRRAGLCRVQLRSVRRRPVDAAGPRLAGRGGGAGARGGAAARAGALTMAAVRLENLRKRFGEMAAIDRVSLELPSGSFLTLLGPSGCGKTTTLRAIAGLVEPDEGRIEIGGEDVTRLPVHRRDLAMVFQSHALFPHMRVADNVAFGLRMRGRPRGERLEAARRALALVRLGGYEDRWPHELSGGQQQRVALARALVVDPRVLLLDEPFGALDRKLREAMQAELRDIVGRLGITAIFVTHDQEEAMLLSDRIAVMNAGRIEQLGTPAEVFEAPQTRFVASFMGVDNILVRRKEGGAVGIGGARLPVEGGAEGAEVAIGLRPERLALVPRGQGIAARVEAATYLGAVSSYRCRLEACGTEIVVREPNPAGGAPGPRLVAGAEVGIAMGASRLRALRGEEG